MNSLKTDLTEGPIVKNIILFSVPILLSNFLQQLYNSVDSMVVGRYAGADSLAAVGSTGALINLLIGFFLGISTGTGIIYAMHFGAGDYKGLKKLIDSAIVLSILISVIITVAGVFFSDALLGIMNIPEKIYSEAKSYLLIILYGTVANMVYNVGAGMIRAEGDSFRPLMYLAIGGVGNLFVDILLVAKFNMGAAGAAVATVVSQIVTAILVVIRLMKLNKEYALNLRKIRPDRLAAWDITRMSVPCGLQNSMYNISNFIVQVKINSFGPVAMAGITAYGKIDAFIYMPMGALSLAVSTYIGQNLGAGRFDRMRKGILTTLFLGIFTGGFLSILVYLFFNPLIRLFTTQADAIAFGREMMLFLVPVAWTYMVTDCLGGAIRGSGGAGIVTIIIGITVCLSRILWLEIVLKLYPVIENVFIVYPISWTLCNIVMTIYYFKKSTLRKSILKQCALRN